MREEKNTELGKTDRLEQKLKQMLSEELSDIQVSEELIQRTLQAAQKASLPEASKEMEMEGKATQESGRKAASENRKQKQKFRIHLFQGCAVAAALLLVLGLGFRSIRFSMKSDSAGNGNHPAYDADGFSDNGNYSGNGNYFEYESPYNGEPENSGSSQEGTGGQWVEDGMQASQAVPTSYPGEWADGALTNEAAALEEDRYKHELDDAGWDAESPAASSPADTEASNQEPEDIDRELWISRAVALLSDMDEMTDVELLEGFTEEEESDGGQCAYREFHYVASRDEEMEIIGRIYPNGRLEGKLIQHGQITYKAVTGRPEMEQLWEILNNGTKGGGME